MEMRFAFIGTVESVNINVGRTGFVVVLMRRKHKPVFDDLSVSVSVLPTFFWLPILLVEGGTGDWLGQARI